MKISDDTVVYNKSRDQVEENIERRRCGEAK